MSKYEQDLWLVHTACMLLTNDDFGVWHCSQCDEFLPCSACRVGPDKVFYGRDGLKFVVDRLESGMPWYVRRQDG